MGINRVEFEPWFDAIARRRKKQKNIRHQNIRTAESIRNHIISLRKQFLGSDFSVNKLVQIDKKPWEEGAEELAGYLADNAYAFMCREYHKGRNGLWCKDWYDGFFHYTTLWFAHGQRACLDDYIRLAETFENNPNTIHIVLTENLPDELAEDAGKWVMQNEAAPLWLTECVTAAVACFTGAMAEPKEMEDENNE